MPEPHGAGGARAFARRYGPSAFVEAWSYLGWAMGPRRRRLRILPALAVVQAIVDTVVLIALVQLVLLLVDDARAASFDPPTVGRLEISFAQLAVLVVGGGIISMGLRWATATRTAEATAEAIAGARRRVLRSWFGAGWERARNQRLGELQQLLGGSAEAGGVAARLVGPGVLAVVNLVVYAAIILLAAPVVAVALGAVGATVAAVFAPLRRRAKRAATAARAASVEVQLTATSYALLNRELHVFAVADQAVGALEQQVDAAVGTFRRMRQLTGVLPSLYQQTVLIGIVGMLALARMTDTDASTFGTAAVLGVRAVSYMQQLNNVSQAFLEARPYLKQVRAATRSFNQAARRRGGAALDRIERLELRGVGYTYGDGALALTDVDLVLRQGDWLGVVGPSGAGKSTLAHLVAGLIDPTVGTILANGRPAREHDPAAWSRQLALLAQEPLLLRASALENIRFHRDIPDERVRSAAVRAGIDAELQALPNGYDTMLGDGFANLSGGQRQRVALARALAGDPSVLILDEPTSALDAASEQLIERSLANIDERAIVIVVAHRPALLARCGRIVEVNGGRLSERHVDPEGIAR